MTPSSVLPDELKWTVKGTTPRSTSLVMITVGGRGKRTPPPPPGAVMQLDGMSCMSMRGAANPSKVIERELRMRGSLAGRGIISDHCKVWAQQGVVSRVSWPML
jgi:hypothetical protein